MAGLEVHSQHVLAMQTVWRYKQIWTLPGVETEDDRAARVYGVSCFTCWFEEPILRSAICKRGVGAYSIGCDGYILSLSGYIYREVNPNYSNTGKGGIKHR